MFLPALLPLLLTATSLAPRPAFAVLLPPEGNDYPLYDFPSLQYLPHNSLAEYQDPRSFSEEEKMEISTRSTYFPLPSSSSSDPSSSSSPSSSASVATVSCTPEDLASMLNIDDLDKMIRIVSKVEGKSAKDVLLKLALKHGLHLKDRDVILPKNRARDYKVPAISPRGVSMPPRAVLVVLNAAREEVARTAVDLGPRMALLDVLKEAKSVFALNNGPYRQNPFSFKAKRLEAERCLGLQTMGRVTASPSSALTISVTRTRPLAEVIWESACLPRVADLLVHRDDIIVLAPR